MKIPLINKTLAMQQMRQVKPTISSKLEDVTDEDRKAIHKITSRART